MPPITESLHDGLVSPSLREPSLLGPGELARVDDAYYRPNSPAPEPFPGRNKLTGSASLAPVVTATSVTTPAYAFDGVEWGIKHIAGAVNTYLRCTQANIQVLADNARAADATVPGIITRIEGFEGGGDDTSSKLTMFQGIGGTAIGVQSGIAHTPGGQWAFRVAAPNLGTAVGFMGVAWDANGGSNEYSNTAYENVLASFYVSFTAFPAATDNPFLTFHDTGSTVQGRLDITSGGLLKVQTGTPTTGSALNLSEWYRLDVLFSRDDSAIRVYIDGVLDIDVSVALGTSVETVGFGKAVATANTYTCYFDDVIIQATNDSTLIAIQGAYGGWVIKRSLPIADGYYDGVWTNTTDPDSWDSVDDAPDNADTNLARSTNPTDYQTWTCETASTLGITGLVLAVQYTPVARYETAIVSLHLLCRAPAGSSGSDNLLTTVINATSVYRVYGWCSSTPPHTTRWSSATTTTTYSTTYPEQPLPLRFISGIRFIQRETGTDLIIVHSNTEFLYGTVSEDNVAFESIPQVVEHLRGQSLESAQIGSKFILANGVTPIIVMDPAGNSTTVASNYKLGMQKPNTPTVAAYNGAGGAMTPGFWWVWITEYNVISGIESAASDRSVVEVDVTNDNILVTFPAVVNAETTVWRVYLSGPTADGETTSDPFPSGYGIVNYDIATGTAIANPDQTIDSTSVQFSYPFPKLDLTIGGVTIPFQKSGETIPNPTTIDVFENQLVCNDLNNPNQIRYGFPDEPGCWPDPYFLTSETNVQDVPIKIRRVGNALVVLMRSQVIRINYLPSEADPDFRRGRVWDIVSSSQGVVGLQAADLVSFDGGAPALVFFSHSYGLYATDGYRCWSVDTDVDWEAEVGELDTVVVRDFPRLQLVMVSYAAPGATTNNRTILLHYHASHRKDDRLKATGPLHYGFVDACYLPSRHLDEHTLATLEGSDSQIWRENRGEPPFPAVLRTRKLRGHLPTDFININRLFIRHGQSDSSGTVQLITERPGEPTEALPPVEIDMQNVTLTQLDVGREVQTFQLEFSSWAPINYWIAET